MSQAAQAKRSFARHAWQNPRVGSLARPQNAHGIPAALVDPTTAFDGGAFGSTKSATRPHRIQARPCPWTSKVQPPIRTGWVVGFDVHGHGCAWIRRGRVACGRGAALRPVTIDSVGQPISDFSTACPIVWPRALTTLLPSSPTAVSVPSTFDATTAFRWTMLPGEHVMQTVG